MQINPYVHYDGNCEEAFKFYEKALGGKIEMLARFGEAPGDMPKPPNWDNKVMHGSITFDGEMLMGCDAPPDYYKKPQGFSVSVTEENLASAEATFKAISEGGTVGMPFQPTFWAKGFGMCTDKFGINWMINCPAQ